jgi:hypothetical protein
MHRLNEEEAVNDEVESKVFFFFFSLAQVKRATSQLFSTLTLTQKPDDKAGKNV